MRKLSENSVSFLKNFLMMIKIRFLDSDLEPRFKNGTGALIALGVGSAVAGLAGSAISASESNKIANKNLQAQQRENQINRDWQTLEAEKSRQFEVAQVNRQNAYNSPSAQAARLQAAGINPVLAMGSNGLTNISASPSAAPTPSPVGGISPVSQQPLDLQIPQLMGAFSQVLAGTANAKKAGVETSYLEKSMDLNLRNLSADASLKELTAIGLKLDNYVKDHIKDSQVRLAYNEAKKMYYDALVSKMTVGKVENEAALVKSQERLNDVLKDLHGSENELIKLDISTYMRRLNSALKLQSAQAQEARSTAQNQKSQAALNNWETKWRQKTEGWRKDEFFESLEGLRKDNAIKAWQEQTAQAAYKIQQNAADHAEVLFWKDFIIDIVNSGVDAFTSIKNSRSWENLTDASQRRVDANLERMRHEFGDKVEVRTPNSRGGTTTKTYRRPYQKYGFSKD